LEVTDAELAKINKFTLEPLEADKVFIFKVAACDNEIDDRNFEPFNLRALKDLKKLYVGKTVIKDHSRRADNQIARVYDAELVSDTDKVTGANEVFTTLVLKCYMVKTSRNADLITEIKAGIKKEVSTGTRAKKMICSICGVDNMKTYCPHYWGREYDGKICYFTLDGAKDALELSFVAVPAQPRAGAVKHYKEMDEHFIDDEQKDAQTGAETPTKDETETPENIDNDEEKKKEMESAETLLRVKMSDAFLFTHIHKEVSEHE
jgi:hypothetical protein